jgi:AcrR family transcriptional regulator
MKNESRKKITSNKIQNGLVHLLFEKNLDDITVTELCNLIDLNRTTFYLYYNNVREVYHEIADTVIKEMQLRLKKQKAKNEMDFYSAYIDTALQEKSLFIVMHREVPLNDFVINKFIELYNEFCQGDLFVPNKNENLIYSYKLYGFYGLVNGWLKGGCMESKEELLEILLKFDKL